MKAAFLTRFRPRDDIGWADDAGPRMEVSVATELRGVRTLDNASGSGLSGTLTIQFAADPPRDCADIVSRARWGVSPLSYPSLALSSLRVSSPRLVAMYDPEKKTVATDGESIAVQFPAGNLAGALSPRPDQYRVRVSYDPALSGGERPLSLTVIGPEFSSHRIPVRLIIVVAGNSERVVELIEDGDAFHLSSSHVDADPTHSGITRDGLMAFDADKIGLNHWGTISQQWTLTVVSSPALGRSVRISGQSVGEVGDYRIGSTVEPINPAAKAPYFTLDATGWAVGDPGNVGDRLIFSTAAALANPLSITCDDTVTLDEAALVEWVRTRNGAALTPNTEYAIFLETAQGWGAITWRAAHNCPAAGSAYLPGRVRFNRSRPSDGTIFVYDRERLPVGTLVVCLTPKIIRTEHQSPVPGDTQFRDWSCVVNGGPECVKVRFLGDDGASGYHPPALINGEWISKVGIAQRAPTGSSPVTMCSRWMIYDRNDKFIEQRRVCCTWLAST